MPLEALHAARARKAEQDARLCRRRSRRKQTAVPAKLTFAKLRLSVSCTVVDMSGSGAKLLLSLPTQATIGDLNRLPDRLKLNLPTDRLQIDCEIVWRRAGKLGVRFLSPARPYSETTLD